MDRCEPIGPVQVVYKKDGRLELNEDGLSSILKDVLDKKLAILSIAGAFRTGKTFLLNFCLRYLQQPWQDVGDSWLGDEQSPITGFPWKNGMNRDTEGIQMWGKPFVIKDSDNCEIAVLLMDTQGLFDGNSTVQENIDIFALSLMTSSVQIFNVQSNIGSDTLNRLQYFADYAKFFQTADDPSPPFQKIVFLVRDWSVPYECAYGFDGGKHLLDSRLKVGENEQDELKTLKTCLRSCSSDLSCFLLPDPGPTVKSEEHFQGKLSDIEKTFVKHVKSLIPAMLAPNAIKVKEMCAMTIRGRDFFELLKKLVEAFQSKSLPAPGDLFEIFGVLTIEQASQNSRDCYQRDMDEVCSSGLYLNEEELADLHNESKNKALRLFQDAKKVVRQSTASLTFEALCTGLDEMLKAYKTENQKRKPLKGPLRVASKLSEKLSKVGIFVGPTAIVGGGAAMIATAVVCMGPIGIGVAVGVGGAAAISGAIATAVSARKIRQVNLESQARKDE